MGHRNVSATPRTRRAGVRLGLGAAAGALALSLAACGGDDAAPVAEAAQAESDDAGAEASTPVFGLVSAAAAAELGADPDIAVIDVRTPEEYADGHLANAALIDFNAPSFADEIATLDPDQEYLVYCRSGNRSAQAVAMLREIGVDRVYELDGGIAAWSAAGLPLQR